MNKMKISNNTIAIVILLSIVSFTLCSLKKKHKSLKNNRANDAMLSATSSATSNSFSAQSSSSFSQQSSFSSSSSSSSSSAINFGIGFQSESIYESGETLNLARCVADLIFEEGGDEHAAKAKKQTLDNCFANLNNNIERSTPFLKRFFDESNKISKAPLIMWNNLIFESTILQALKEYSLPHNKNVSCDQALLPFAQPYSTSHYSDMEKCFRRSFDGHSNQSHGTSVGKAQFLKGPVANRRERLPNNFFRNLNSASRK